MPAAGKQPARQAHRRGARFAALWRGLAASLLVVLLAAVVTANTARAFNVYADYFITLSARPLAMGGAAAALSDPAAVFYNPAGLAGIRRPALCYNHSGRHFPGSTEGGMHEWDQLDGDTEAIVVPLPLGAYAHGFIFSGEMGYDYRGHPDDYSLGYPREHYWGTEDYDAFATSCGLPLAVGYGLRRSLGRFTPDPTDSNAPSWLRHGEGQQWGVLARVWPGLDYGHSELKLNYDWTLLARAANGADSFGEFSSKHLTKRSGWALHPVGWLTLTSDDVSERHIFDRGSEYGLTAPEGLGTVHLGNADRHHSHRGAELSLGALARLRRGSYAGHPTWGAALNLGGLWLNYAEIEDLLPDIVGSGSDFADVHIYGADATLW
jgi:hypothetical protein